MLSPYANDSDDRLAQLCQMQIFFALISSMLLRWDDLNAAAGVDPTQNLDVLLTSFTFLPISFALVVHVLEEVAPRPSSNLPSHPPLATSLLTARGRSSRRGCTST